MKDGIFGGKGYRGFSFFPISRLKLRLLRRRSLKPGHYGGDIYCRARPTNLSNPAIINTISSISVIHPEDGRGWVVGEGGCDGGGGGCRSGKRELEKEKGDEKGGFEILFRLSWVNEKYCNV